MLCMCEPLGAGLTGFKPKLGTGIGTAYWDCASVMAVSMRGQWRWV
jgi:hypothetical protein